MKQKKQQYKFGRCVHCLKQSNQIDNDHIFPSAWYPDNTPNTIERWTVPSCVPCNHEHGINEQGLLIWLGMCIGTEDAQAIGIADKALRSIDPNAGKNNRDRNARQAMRNKVLRNVKIIKNPQIVGILPNFGPDPTLQYEDYQGIKIPEAALTKLGEKIVRGLTYHFEKRFIEKNDEEINIFFNYDNDVTPIVNMAKKFGQTFIRGPGISVTRATAGDGSRAAIFIIEIWGRLKIYATLLPKSSILD